MPPTPTDGSPRRPTPSLPPFRIPIPVRGHELDALGHVNQAVHHQWAEHAPTELFQPAPSATRGQGT